MRLTYIGTLCIMGVLFGLAGCDPAALVKTKVPGPVQTLLTFTEAHDPSKPIATIDLASPKENGVYGSHEPVNFQANVQTGKAQLPAPPVIAWNLVSAADKKKVPLGSGARVSKRLEAGKYEADITVDVAGQKISKKVTFRVALQMPGKVVSPEGKGVPDVEVLVMDLNGMTVLFRSRTANNGTFSFEVPAEGSVLVKPQKKGFSFYPISQTVKYSATPSQTEFSGMQAEITNMRLTDVKNPSLVLTGLCPGELVSLSFEIIGGSRPKSYEVALIKREKEAEQTLRLTQEGDPSVGQTTDSRQSQALTLRLPENVRLASAGWTGHVRLTVMDDKDNRYAVEAPDAVQVNLEACLVKFAERATELLGTAKPEEALSGFNSCEKIVRQLDDSPNLRAIVYKINLNRSLALLMSAQAQKPKSTQRMGLLEQALANINRDLKTRSKDDQSLFLKGVAEYLGDNYKSALQDFDAVLALREDNREANLLRAIVCLKTGVKKNVSAAIDDLTNILTKDPSNTEFRKARTAALKVLIQFQDRKDDERIDTSEIPVPDISSVMNLHKYIVK